MKDIFNIEKIYIPISSIIVHRKIFGFNPCFFGIGIVLLKISGETMRPLAKDEIETIKNFFKGKAIILKYFRVRCEDDGDDWRRSEEGFYNHSIRLEGIYGYEKNSGFYPVMLTETNGAQHYVCSQTSGVFSLVSDHLKEIIKNDIAILINANPAEVDKDISDFLEARHPEAKHETHHHLAASSPQWREKEMADRDIFFKKYLMKIL